MSRFIRERAHHEETRHYLFFQLLGHTQGTGKSFECDAGGAPLRAEHVARRAREHVAELVAEIGGQRRGSVQRLPAHG